MEELLGVLKRRAPFRLEIRNGCFAAGQNSLELLRSVQTGRCFAHAALSRGLFIRPKALDRAR